MFAGRHELRKDNHGRIFVDRDGESFLGLINYLRNGRRDVPLFENKLKRQLFEDELEFWGMKEDVKKLR